MADVVLMADAEIGAEADRLSQEFTSEVEAMRRRRAAAGAYRQGSMISEISTIGQAKIEALRMRAEAVFAATRTRALWITAPEEQALLDSAATHLQALHDATCDRVRVAAAELAAARVLGEVEPPLQACLDRCKERLVLVLQQQRQAGRVSTVKRCLGLIPSIVKAVVKWAVGLLPGR